MNPTHYHYNLFERLVFITLIQDGSQVWTSDNHKASSCVIFPIQDLIGKQVKKGKSIGIIQNVHSTKNEWVWESSKRIEFYSSQVGVVWQHGLEYYWQDIHKLEIKDLA